MKKIILVISLLCLVLGADAKTKYNYYPNTSLRPDRTIFLYVPTAKEAKKALKSIPDPVHASRDAGVDACWRQRMPRSGEYVRPQRRHSVHKRVGPL